MSTSDSVFGRVEKPHERERTSRRINLMKISPIKEMELLGSEYSGSVSLGQGTPSFATPCHIREAAIQAIRDGLTDKYSLGPGIRSLREAISAKLLSKNGIECDPASEVLVTTGACEALAAVMLCILDPGDEVLITSPCYSPHLEQIRMAGGEAVFVPLDESAGWKLDVELVTRLITHKSKAIIINTPLNPTGSLIDKDVLLELAEIAIRNRLFIVTDETYEDFIYDGSRHFSVRSMPELRECGISVFSFSKSYALTGWRCGYAVASAGIINQLLKVHDATCICAPLPGQYAALAALRGPQNCIQEFRSELLARRELVLRKLQAMRRISCVNPRAAYYILAKVDGLSDSLEYCISLLREAGVVVTPGGAFGPAGEGHFRISYCMSESVITEGLNRIIAFESARA